MTSRYVVPQEGRGRVFGAKVILSTRSAESWFDSVNTTIMAEDTNAFIRNTPLREMFELCLWRDFEAHILERDYMVKYYRQREEEIRDTVPPERLLVFEAKEGWGPLCRFLEVDEPTTPYPRVNSREETRKLLDMMINAQPGGMEETMRQERGRLFGEQQDEPSPAGP